MSNFYTQAKNRKTGDIVDVMCSDNFFGQHRYAYFVDGSEKPLAETEFSRMYEIEHQEDK